VGDCLSAKWPRGSLFLGLSYNMFCGGKGGMLSFGGKPLDSGTGL